MHWIQAKKSWEDEQPMIDVSIAVHHDGVVAVRAAVVSKLVELYDEVAAQLARMQVIDLRWAILGAFITATGYAMYYCA